MHYKIFQTMKTSRVNRAFRRNRTNKHLEVFLESRFMVSILECNSLKEISKIASLNE